MKKFTLKFPSVFTKNFIIFRNLTIEESVLNNHKKQLNKTIKDLSEQIIDDGSNRYLEIITRSIELLKNNSIR